MSRRTRLSRTSLFNIAHIRCRYSFLGIFVGNILQNRHRQPGYFWLLLLLTVVPAISPSDLDSDFRVTKVSKYHGFCRRLYGFLVCTGKCHDGLLEPVIVPKVRVLHLQDLSGTSLTRQEHPDHPAIRM